MSKDKVTMADLPKMSGWAQKQILDANYAKPKRARKAKQYINPAHWQGKELDFQHHVEQWLGAQGYAKRNKKSILGTHGKGGRIGWQVHVARAIGNPYVLDVLLLRHDGRWLELELKTAKGACSEIQIALIGDKQPCRCLDDVMTEMMVWG